MVGCLCAVGFLPFYLPGFPPILCRLSGREPTYVSTSYLPTFLLFLLGGYLFDDMKIDQYAYEHQDFLIIYAVSNYNYNYNYSRSISKAIV